MATHSSILAWRIPWMEELDGPQFMGSQSWTRLSTFTSGIRNYSRAEIAEGQTLMTKRPMDMTAQHLRVGVAGFRKDDP